LVPERRRLFPFMTVLENLEIGAYAAEARSVARQTLDEVFTLLPVLAERRKQIAGSMSGGEQQMLAIGRALMQSRVSCCWTSRPKASRRSMSNCCST